MEARSKCPLAFLFVCSERPWRRRPASHADLTELRDWCVARISKLSRAGKNRSARALTAEQLELLEAVNRRQMPWMLLEADG
jgi:hypothetical protein